MPNPPESPATISESTNWKTPVVIAALSGSIMLASGAAWMQARIAENADRTAALASRVDRLESHEADRALQIQRLEDNISHVRETVDRIDAKLEKAGR